MAHVGTPSANQKESNIDPFLSANQDVWAAGSRSMLCVGRFGDRHQQGLVAASGA